MIDKFLEFLGWTYIHSYDELCSKYTEYEHVDLPDEFPVWVKCSGVMTVADQCPDLCYDFEYLHLFEIDEFKKENDIS